MAQDREAATVWQVIISEHENDYHLTRVEFEGGSLSLAAVDAEIGTMLRVQIYARDVSISLVEPNSTSILNILPAVISQLTEESDSQAVVQLRVGQS